MVILWRLFFRPLFGILLYSDRAYFVVACGVLGKVQESKHRTDDLYDLFPLNDLDILGKIHYCDLYDLQ